MDSRQIRRENLATLIAKIAYGNQATFAGKLGLDASHLSQMLTGHRGMGPRFARKLEGLLFLPHGAMDSLMPKPDEAPLSDAESAKLLEQVMGFWGEIGPTAKRGIHALAREAFEHRLQEQELEVQRLRNKHDAPQPPKRRAKVS